MIIYTAIIDNYDTLREPIVKNNVRYICLTNTDVKSDFWEVVKVEGSGVKLAREIKIRPYKFLPEHDESIWMDANIVQNSVLNFDYENLMTMKHPSRDCILKELEACYRLGKDDLRRMTKQVQRYKNYPQNNGLIASGVIARKNNEKVKELCELWWSEVKRGSHRDQLSFNYCAWLLEFKYNTFDFMKGFKYYKHG